MKCLVVIISLPLSLVGFAADTIENDGGDYIGCVVDNHNVSMTFQPQPLANGCDISTEQGCLNCGFEAILSPTEITRLTHSKSIFERNKPDYKNRCPCTRLN
ncbi:hypothetical protein N9B72_02050 [Bacteriovoracaceae bacterium]|nr:hypothetical protein [Bacteriovoracaceae bacterium]